MHATGFYSIDSQIYTVIYFVYIIYIYIIIYFIYESNGDSNTLRTNNAGYCDYQLNNVDDLNMIRLLSKSSRGRSKFLQLFSR